MRNVTVAATQMACSWDVADNVARAEEMVRDAAGLGAQIILLQELFETPYFCIEEASKHNVLAKPIEGNALIGHFQNLAKELEVVLPISFYERAGNTRFNSVVIVDADGEIKNHYRKSHIPHSPGYQEKYYFSPGDTGFTVTQTRYAKIGVGICWDQWFPEAARIMALKGAEIIFYPTAIGSEPSVPDYDSMPHWRRVMQGHAGANIVPVVASNRIGTEEATINDSSMTFYGSSFIADQFGALMADADRATEGVHLATLDLDGARADRDGWGVWRDRRPDLYTPILKMDDSV